MSRELYNIELTLEEIMVIGNSLVELPYKHTAHILHKISEQVESQKKEDQDKLETEHSRNR